MEFKFIATNADNVGDGIGQAIANDDHEGLGQLTANIDAGQNGILQWIQSVGGEVVTSSGDEIIAKIPFESYNEAAIENLRSEYELASGVTVTVGVGDSMSEASKALIYGKLNDKNQIVEYDLHLEDYIASHGEEISPEDQEFEQEVENQMGEGEEIPTPDQDAEGDEYTDSENTSDEEYEDASAADLIGGQQVDNPEYQEEVPEMEETAEGDGTLAEEGEMSEDDLDINPADKLDGVVGEDLDGDGDIDAMPATDDPMLQDASAGGEIPSQELPNDGQVQPEGEEQPPAVDENGMPIEGGGNNQSALTDMIHANMGGEDQDEADGASDERLRQDIANSLITFKENKPMLEQAKVENPKLYEATILMLSSMIEMAKKLNMNPEADVDSQEAQDALPDAEMGQMEEEEQPPMPEQEDDAEAESEDAENLEEVEDEAGDDNKQENKNKYPFGKSEVAKLYSDLVKGCNVLQKFGNKRVNKTEKAPAKKKQ